jgi:hypothetical protein
VEERSICCKPWLAPITLRGAENFSLTGFRDLPELAFWATRDLDTLERQVSFKLDRAKLGELKWRRDIKRFVSIVDPVFEIRWDVRLGGVERKLRLAVVEESTDRSSTLLGWFCKVPEVDSDLTRESQNVVFEKLLEEWRKQ